MSEARLHGWLVWAVIASAALTFLYLLGRAVPYGRHYRGTGWGPHAPSPLGWIAMELPAVVVFMLVYRGGSNADQIVPMLFLSMWQGHYLNRTFIYPLRTRGSLRRMPVLVIGSAFLFNAINAYINARTVSELGNYGIQWLGDPRFLLGAGIFLAGMAVNLHADNILLRLRQPGETAYAIPQGGAFRFVSSANYLGEMVEWTGWAIATWSLSGLAFALLTAANLIPRARSNHCWYRQTFAEYPAKRKVLIPGIY